MDRWRCIFLRTGRRAIEDGVPTIASGIAFFTVLAIFPGIAAVVGLYSLFADPKVAEVLLSVLPSVVPDYAVRVIAWQVKYAASRRADVQGLGIASALGLALLFVSTNRGTAALFRGLNVVYRQPEKRGLVRFTAMSLAFTVGAIFFLLFAIGAAVLLPALLRVFGLGETAATVIGLLRWPALLLVVAAALAIVYRFGASRDAPDWRCIMYGAGAASFLWVIVSLLFSFAVWWLDRLDELYGPVSAIIGLMIWAWLSIITVLVGAELDATIGETTKSGRSGRC